MKISGLCKNHKTIKLTPENLNQLESNLLKYCSSIEYSCTTINGNDIQFDSLNELLNYDNYGKSSIKSLLLLGYRQYHRVIRIDFETKDVYFLNYNTSCECSYECDSTESEILLVKMLRDFFNKHKTSYWVIGKFSLFSLYFLFSLSLLVFLYIKDKSIFDRTEFVLSEVIPIFVAICIGEFLLWQIDKKVLLKILKPTVFYWGEEVKAYDKYSKLRSNLFWCVLIAIAVGIAVAYILSLTNQ